MKRIKLILIGLFLLGALCFFLYTIEKDEEISNKTLVNSQVVPVDAYPYYMKFQGNTVVIYNLDHSVFELTDLRKDYLPDELIYEIRKGKYFRNQQELYEFLETYTS